MQKKPRRHPNKEVRQLFLSQRGATRGSILHQRFQHNKQKFSI